MFGWGDSGMELISLEQMEILMMVAGSEAPLQTALEVRKRWRYILGIAQAACQGICLDTSLPQVVRNCEGYKARAERIISILDEWVAEHSAADTK